MNVERIKRLLQSGKVSVSVRRFHYSRRTLYGECFTDTGAIFINKRKTDKVFTRTLIHECLHVLNPSWSERKVLVHERLIYYSLSDEDRGWFHGFFGGLKCRRKARKSDG